VIFVACDLPDQRGDMSFDYSAPAELFLANAPNPYRPRRQVINAVSIMRLIISSFILLDNAHVNMSFGQGPMAEQQDGPPACYGLSRRKTDWT